MNWGDSADDEDDNFFAPENNPPVVAERVEEPATSSPLVVDDQVEAARPIKEFILPEHAPYTAFVGNLAFSVRDPQQLADAISDLVRERFGEEIVITAKRVALDRQASDKPKGFGYVEVETLDHVSSGVESVVPFDFILPGFLAWSNRWFSSFLPCSVSS